MADVAQLKLQVGLDLAFFRQQLALLGTTATSYSLPINIDRLGIQKEITKLGRNISGRKYTLKITSDVSAINADVIKLQKALENVGKESVNVQITGTGNLDPKEARKIRTALGRSILANGGKIKIPATILAAITKDDVTAFTRAAQAKLSEIALNVRADITSSADGLDTKEVRRIRVALRNAILSNGGKIKIPATIEPSIGSSEVSAFRKLVQEKFKGISVTVGVDAQISGKTTAAQNPAKTAALEAARQSLARLNAEQLRSRAIKSLGEESRTTKQIIQWVDTLKAENPNRKEKSKALTAIRDFLAHGIVDNISQDIEARLQPLRGQKAMEAPRSASNINKILDPIANFTQNPGVARGMLRMLPESQISTNVLDVASRQARYYEGVPSARETQGQMKGFDPLMKALAANFSDYARSLSITNPWIGTIGKGIAQMVSTAAASPQAQKLLPAAGQSSASKMMRSAFTGLPPIQAPSIGQDNARLSRAATYSLNEARKALGMPLGPSSPYMPNPFAGAATVPPRAQAGGGLNLPPAGATSNYSASARRAAWAQTYQQSRFMQAPSMPTAPTATKDINTLMAAIGNLGSKAASTASQIQGKVKSGLQKASDLITGFSNARIKASSKIPSLALPSAEMTTGGSAYRQAQLQSRMAAAYTRSAAREASVLGESQMYARVSGQVPLSNPAPRLPAGNQGGALALRNAPSGGRGDSSGFGGFANAMAGIKLPGAGIISELGGEFAQAAKQVLLFGTAYKALAFLTGFPAQVSEAVAQLQTFNNTLKAITPSSDEFRASNQFILDTVDKYNIPIQSARDGFTKLYASMKPAGFSGEQIQKLFLGISKASATLGLSSDKVDRVTYAFSQMASKGQLMSEEVTGQLGDVIPGALSIMAKAANMDIATFKKAMEDGVFVGKAFTDVMSNVPIVLDQLFGKGAEGAAKTFQGQMNAMANATQKLYESFEPVANLFAINVVKPLTEGVKVAADGFNAFFTGQQAATKGGADLAAKLQELKPTFEGLASNAKLVADRVIDLSKAFVPLLELGAKLLATPLAGFLAQTYVSVLLLNSAFTVLATTGVGAAIASFAQFTKGVILQAGVMMGLIKATQQSTFAMYQLTSAARGMWLAMTGPVGLAVLGIAAVTAALYTMHKPSREYLDSIPARYQSFWEDLARQAGTAAWKTKEAWASLTSFFGQIINNIVKAFQEQINKLPGFVQDAVGFIAPIFEGLMPIFDRVTKWIGTNWKGMIAEMINSANPLYGIAKTLGIDVGAATVKAGTGPAPGDPKKKSPNYTVAGITYDGMSQASIGQSLSPFVPEVKLCPITGATGDGDSKGSAADDAKRVAEQIKQQLKSAQDLKFEQQNRLTLLRAENDFTKAFTSFSIQRLEIERRYSELLKQSKSPEETATLQQARSAEYKQSSLTLQQQINDLLKQAQAPLNDAVESIKNQAAFEREYGELIKNGTNPEVAKQVIAIRNAYNESVKLLEPALAAAQAAVTKAEAEGASATEIKKYREELERIEAIRKGLAGKKAEGETAAREVSTPIFGDKIKAEIEAAKKELAKLIDKEDILIGAANSIGDAFSSAFKGIIDGSMTAQQALASFFQNIGNYFVDMVVRMIAEWIKFLALEGIKSILSGLNFGGGKGKSVGIENPIDFTAANGGIAAGGFRAFATGGIVTGPTLGLVGEGRYNEAVIPLPDGKSVPVDLSGAPGGNAFTSNIVINISSDGQSSSNVNGANSAELGRKIEGAVKQVMVAELRPGGILAGRR